MDKHDRSRRTGWRVGDLGEVDMLGNKIVTGNTYLVAINFAVGGVRLKKMVLEKFTNSTLRFRNVNNPDHVHNARRSSCAHRLTQV